MRRRTALLAAVVIGLIGVASSVQFNGKRTPPSQPALTKIDVRSFDDLKREFNKSSDGTRIILLLSPT